MRARMVIIAIDARSPNFVSDNRTAGKMKVWIDYR